MTTTKPTTKPGDRDVDQNAVFAFLGDPATHGIAAPVKRIETHGAVVFLSGPDVYKVKRAVRFSYMDFSTLEKRKAACEREVAVNRDNAPSIYLGVVPVTRDASGLHLGGTGEMVEWLVHMRRFDETATLDHIVEGSGLSADLVDRLAATIAAAHARAPIRKGPAAEPDLHKVVKDCASELADKTDILPAEGCHALVARLIGMCTRWSALLRRRSECGYVRRCHGDLHLRNITIIDKEPVLFDAIEFDEAIATIDILYDLAFLVMDLCERGLRAPANRLLNRYLWMAADEKTQIEGLALMPFFLSLRAAIRAHVLATQSRLARKDENLRSEARRYLDFSCELLEPVSPRLVAVGGFSGTGKSTLAAAISSHFGAAPGAVHLRSDIERKRLFGVAETDRLPAEAYQANVSDRVYDELQKLAEAALEAGRSVIVDATWQGPHERQTIMKIAARANVPFTGLWLDAPLELCLERVRRRKNDASDADSEVVRAQAQHEIGGIDWQRLDASTGLETLQAAALRACV